jgi:DNA-binding GntR family transcriptional regulator
MTLSEIRPVAPADAGVSSTVQSIFERILATIHDGGLRPGAIVRDVDIARELGLSRTPVREAFQMLREAGVLEVSASRFTRIAVLTPEQTEQAARAWLPLFSTVLDELVARDTPVDAGVLDGMEAAHADAVAGVMSFNNPRVAAANARLYDAAVGLSTNHFLIKAVGSVAHALRLGLLSLPAPIDLSLLLRAQRETIDAIRDRDQNLADQAVMTLGQITIPRE